MKTYNALSKSFTDEVKTIIEEGKSIDEAFEDVKTAIIDNNFGEPTPTPVPDSTPAPIATPPPTPESTPTPTPKPIDVNELTQGDGQQDGYYYVDLGLSVKWATCNVGSTLASDDGLLFQFGRVDGYRYNDNNNQFRTNAQNKQDTGNEYIPKTASGKTYNVRETLDLADDVAYINMGGAWRMPTKDEFEELLNNTTHKVKTINGIKGMLFTSTINGHQLFIPFAGFWWYNGNGRFAGAGSRACMWSSLSADYTSAYKLICYYSNGDAEITYMGFRSDAFSVRGVFKKQE